jgi:O-antigen ligase
MNSLTMSTNSNKIFTFKLFKILPFILVTLLIVGAISQAVGTVLLFVFCVLIIIFGQKINLTKKALLFLCFLVLCFLIGIINSSDIRLWSEELFRNATLFLLSLIVIQYIKDNGKEVFFDLLYLTILISLIAYPFLLLDGRFTSYFSHPNHLAYLSLLVLYEITTRENLIYLRKFKILTLILIIFLTKSSGGILCLSFLLLVYFSKKGTKYFISFSALTLLIFIFKDSIDALNLINEKFVSFDINEIESRINHMNFGNDTSLIWRITYWGALINQYMRFDEIGKLFGIGYGTMSQGNFAYSWMITDPHNDYVRKLLETGIIGLTIFFFIWLRIFKKSGVGIYCVPIFFLPLLVGNIVVNVPFMVSLIVIIYTYENR